MYRKSTHTDIYLHAESHNHLAPKQLAINTFVHKVFAVSNRISTDRIQSSETSLTKEHDKKDMNKIISKHTSKATNPTYKHHKMRRNLFYSPICKRNNKSYRQNIE